MPQSQPRRRGRHASLAGLGSRAADRDLSLRGTVAVDGAADRGSVRAAGTRTASLCAWRQFPVPAPLLGRAGGASGRVFSRCDQRADDSTGTREEGSDLEQPVVGFAERRQAEVDQHATCTMADRIQRTVMSSRSLRGSTGVALGDPGWLWVRLRARVYVGGVEWGDSVQRESESGDSSRSPWRCDWSMIGPVMSVSPS